VPFWDIGTLPMCPYVQLAAAHRGVRSAKP
jgi:hypothetical protein